MKMRHLLSLAIAVAGGCTTMKPGLGFDEVRRDVADRAGAQVHWNNGSEQDARAAAAVSDLLARNLTAEQAVQIALLNNRELRVTYEELNLAQADLVQAGLLRNPIFSGEVRWSTSGGGTGFDAGHADGWGRRRRGDGRGDRRALPRSRAAGVRV